MGSKISYINEVIFFIKTTKKSNKEFTKVEKIFFLFMAYVVLFAFTFLINLIIGLNHKMIYPTNMFPAYSDIIILLTLFLVPLHEEIMFRLPLTIFNIRYIIISFSFLLSFMVFTVFSKHLYYNDLFPHLIWDYIYYIIFTFIFIIILFKLKRFLSIISGFWGKHFILIFYMYSILFMLVHFDYTIFFEYGMLIEILRLLPKFMIGFFLGFIRINFGFIYALIFHIVINTPTTILLLSISH